MTAPIPFNRPGLAGRELEYAADSVARGHISGDGFYTKRCHGLLEKAIGSGKALLTTSCTHALEMTALLLDVGADDEVIIPSFTFVSTANAYALRGARPVFADIRPDTLNLDERQLERLATPRTKAIVAVHYAGVGCEMDEILAFARPRGIAVIEDNAHGLFGSWRGRALGTFGTFATLSFHETKNVTCGEGGALLVNDPAHFDRAEVVREKGTDRSRFFRGQVDKYSWVDLGSSYLPSDLLAAFLAAQLEEREAIQASRRRIWERYVAGLAQWSAASGVKLPYVPSHCAQSFHMFYLLMPSLSARSGLIAHLKARDILSVFHYLPLHLSAMGRRFGGREGDCPVTEDVSGRLVRLPFYKDLSEHDQDRVVQAILEFSFRAA
jgi:dTDP-4-amino-4,6-dideoxygalactose transaminase